jgi:hypothetical protein
MKATPITVKYFWVTALAVFLSFELHELSHYLTGEALGNTMAMTLNSGYPVAGHYLKDWHATVVSAAGPLFTILQGILFYFLLRKKDNYYLYPFLFISFFMRFSAMIISFFNPNDEARISISLGLGRFTLPAIVSLFLFYLVYTISKQYQYSKRLQLFTVLFSIFIYSSIILCDQYFHVRII